MGDFTVVVRRVDGLDREAMRSLADAAKSKVADGVVFLAGDAGEGRVTMVAAVTPSAAKKAPAGGLVKQLAPLVGGGGGGRPDFAEAGGKDATENPGTAHRGPVPHRIVVAGPKAAGSRQPTTGWGRPCSRASPPTHA